MVEFWKDQDDPTDTGVPIDSDYLHTDTRDESATDAYNPEAEAVTDGGEPLDRTAEGNESDAYKNDEHAVQKWPDGFAQTSTARTTAFAGRDAHGNPVDGWSREKWRIQMGLPVKMRGETCDGCEHCERDDCLEECEEPCAAHDAYQPDCPECSKGCPVCREWCYNDTWEWVAGAEIDNKERNRLTALDGYLDCFEVPQQTREEVKAKVMSEDTSRYWNRHYAGIAGAVVGFMAVEIADSVPEALRDDRLHSDRVTALVEDVGKPLEKIVRHGFKRAEANGWV